MTDIDSLSKSVSVLRDEVLRLNRVVSRLEAHAAGQSVKIKDGILTVAGLLISMASVLWMLQIVKII